MRGHWLWDDDKVHHIISKLLFTICWNSSCWVNLEYFSKMKNGTTTPKTMTVADFWLHHCNQQHCHTCKITVFPLSFMTVLLCMQKTNHKCYQPSPSLSPKSICNSMMIDTDWFCFMGIISVNFKVYNFVLSGYSAWVYYYIMYSLKNCIQRKDVYKYFNIKMLEVIFTNNSSHSGMQYCNFSPFLYILCISYIRMQTMQRVYF